MRGAMPDSPWSGPTHAHPGARGRARVVTVAVVALVALVVGAVAWTMLDEIWDRYWLEHHGQLAEMIVVRVYQDGGGEDGTTTYAVVDIPECRCVAHVHVGTNQHPEGSLLAVWYDPFDPTHAVAA